MFRVIIAGGRDFTDYDLLVKTMNHLLSNVGEDIEIICGKAKGADTLGEQYAKEYRYGIKYFPADWNRYGKAAGYLRNVEMAKNADALVAFLGWLKSRHEAYDRDRQITKFKSSGKVLQ